MKQANDQASEYFFTLPSTLEPLTSFATCLILPSFSERKPGTIEDLTDLLAEDWGQLGSVRDLGAGNKRFLREELERTWGQKHLAVLDEEEAQKWLLGVSADYHSVVDLVVSP